MITIILLALVGAVIASVVGTVWYMPNTPMGKIHAQFLGFDKLTPEQQQAKMAEAKPGMPKMYAAQFLLSFITALFVVFVVTLSIENGVPASMAIAFPVLSWLCFMVPNIGSAILWSNCDRKLAWKKFFSDSLCNLVIILLVAGLAVLAA